MAFLAVDTDPCLPWPHQLPADGEPQPGSAERLMMVSSAWVKLSKILPIA